MIIFLLFFFIDELFINKTMVGYGLLKKNKTKINKRGHYFQEKNIIKVNSFFVVLRLLLRFFLSKQFVSYIDRFKLRCCSTLFRQKNERNDVMNTERIGERKKIQSNVSESHRLLLSDHYY